MDPIAPPTPVLLEIVVDDVAGAVTAEAAGADRVELCADLCVGGTTPSLGMIRRVVAATERVTVQIMVRPRGGDFVYDAAELAVMLEDVAVIREVAAAAPGRVGIVTGALRTDGTVDADAMGALVGAAGDVPVTCHKAIDATPDIDAAYATLAGLGVERVLTSGGARTALQGADALARLVAAGGPAVLAGGGVRPGNVAEVIAASGVTEVHLRAQVESERGDGTLSTDAETIRAVRARIASDAVASA
ncbi:copper homeostasis protein CutC [Demequina soli]|uniref:copper homeostasis protein CutC n=1 Tax=Demequina soli TaxID=1638987 RepID=UPI000784E3CC|nr:copper homeostasis protein CutC [Demequina soli]